MGEAAVHRLRDTAAKIIFRYVQLVLRVVHQISYFSTCFSHFLVLPHLWRRMGVRDVCGVSLEMRRSECAE